MTRFINIVTLSLNGVCNYCIPKELFFFCLSKKHFLSKLKTWQLQEKKKYAGFVQFANSHCKECNKT